ncbi:hypothetical protein [Lactiplantibacillus paraxiangfangensis]|uniref:hypothetical protein n=1 Tax=Lactiplantibacillus paraxiangfangensis TaxID=3076224 RepID=UPI0030C739B0
MASVVKVVLTGDFPVLDHGRAGTIAYFAIVPGEGQDRSSGLTRSHDRMSSVATEITYKWLLST